MTSFHANGKLLLSGEYLVLDGAQGLAIPTKPGQTLHLSENETSSLYWYAQDPKGIFLNCEIQLSDLSILDLRHGAEEEADRLTALLQACRRLNPAFLTHTSGLSVNTDMQFPRDWGLGSSSTLIAMLAEWASIDAFELLAMTFGGSGYDIACAKATSPVFYQLRDGKAHSESTELSQAWSEVLFVYTGQKQDSREAMEHYRAKPRDSEAIQRVTVISEELAGVREVAEIISLVSEHESILSKILDMPTLLELKFRDFKGITKSLGAWGGDFFLAVSEQGKGYVRSYFTEKGYSVILSFDELALLQ